MKEADRYFHKIIQRIGSTAEINASIIKPFQNVLDSLDEVYIFGSKELGGKFYRFFSETGTKVQGFIDNDPSKQNKELHGCKVFSIESLLVQKNAINIVIASFNYLYEINNQLRNLGFANVIPCPVFYLLDETIYRPEPSYDGIVKDLAENKEKYLATYELLADHKSKEVLNAVVSFRLTLDPSLYPTIASTNQYFGEPFIKFEEHDIFIDGGGFDGDTALGFIKAANGKYCKILLFEPDEESFIKAERNLKDYENIEFYKKGLHSESKTLRFTSSGGLGSSIGEDGNVEIEVVAIDEIIDEKSGYIKLDIEGAELEALKGAENQLKQGVQIAVCLYHKARDIWEIPAYIKQVNPEYKFYLRHYSKSIFETVLYAVL